jgi:citrate synthase
VAAGIISLGDFHGGAIENCAEMLQNHVSLAREKSFEKAAEEIVTRYRAEKRRIMGYGHGIHQPVDPRNAKLFHLAQDYEIPDNHIQLSQAIESAIKKIIQKPIPLNVDGAIAAVISDLGIDWRLGKAFFFLGRIVGLTAHAYEQMYKERPMRRVYTWDEVNYKGAEAKKFVRKS